MEPSVSIPETLIRWIKAWLSNNGIADKFLIKPLPGDGSTRAFYRIQIGKDRRIALMDPGWVYSKDYGSHQIFLKSRGIAVPDFLAIDAKEGILLMEDLGDGLLHETISKVPKKKTVYIKLAASILASLHGKTWPVPEDLPASLRSFDTHKYMEELSFTLQHLGGLIKNPPPSHEKIALLKNYCEALSLLGPKVFCHRDYHARNLVLKDDTLYMIDFQDARLGPPHYDVASLLYDAYVDLSDQERDTVEAEYKSELSKYSIFSKISWENFRIDMYAIAFQRSLKAAGSFASFYTRQKKKTHLPYIEPALKNAVTLLDKLTPKLRMIQKVLDPVALLKNWKEIKTSL